MVMHLPVTCRPRDGKSFRAEMRIGKAPPSGIVPVRWGASVEFRQTPEPSLAGDDAVFAAWEGLRNRRSTGQDRQAESVLSDQLGGGGTRAGGGRGGARS
jgi:hypothetical protein